MTLMLFSHNPSCMCIVVKERKKRQQAESRIEALEKSSRQLVEHYDSRMIDLAKQVMYIVYDV